MRNGDSVAAGGFNPFFCSTYRKSRLAAEPFRNQYQEYSMAKAICHITPTLLTPPALTKDHKLKPNNWLKKYLFKRYYKCYKMKYTQLLAKCLLAALTILFMGSCGGGGTKKEVTTTMAGDDGITRVVVNSDDQMRYDTRVIRVLVGSKIELTLNHNGSMPKAGMGHNLVILKTGTDVEEFCGEALTAGRTGYIPESDQIIVHTELIGGGESSTITFDAPALGSYDFVCTFPGHYGVMRGLFEVVQAGE